MTPLRYVLLLAIVLPAQVRASHLRGSEIRFSWVAGTTYAFELVEYIDETAPANQPIAVVDNGDGTPVDSVLRDSILLGISVDCAQVRKDSYTWQHTYAGPGNYTVRCEISNRYASILNLPNGLSEGHCASALLVVLPVPFANSGPVFQNFQTQVGWVGNTLVHTPQPIEPDQDSLVFELVQPLGNGCAPIVTYVTPDQVNPGSVLAIDPSTGEVTFTAPSLLGEYVIAIRCSEYRNNAVIGQVTRDMSFCISSIPDGITEEMGTTGAFVPGSGRNEFILLLPFGVNALVEVFDATGRLLQHRPDQTSGTSVVLSTPATGCCIAKATTSAGRSFTTKAVVR